MCFMKPGQGVGAIRTVIPGELIFAWLQAARRGKRSVVARALAADAVHDERLLL